MARGEGSGQSDRILYRLGCARVVLPPVQQPDLQLAEGPGMDMALDQTAALPGDTVPGLFCRQSSSQILSLPRGMGLA